MPTAIVKFLFWPLLSVPKYGVVSNPAYYSVVGDIFIGTLIIAFFIFIRLKIFGGSFHEEEWPKFLRISAKTLSGLVMIGFLGVMFNLSAMVCNGSKMPVAVQSRMEFDIYNRYGLGNRHILAGPDTPLFIFVDYVRADLSDSLNFLFPAADYVSPGDLMITFCVILSWWLSIVLAAWLLLFTAKEIFAKPPPSKS